MDSKFDNVVSYYFAAVSVTLLVSQVKGRLVVAPQNRVALLGESVQLDCSTDLSVSVNWEHIPLGSTKPIDVYLSRTVVFPYHPRFTVQREEVGVNITAYNLVVTDVRVEDAGTYRCTDRSGMGEKQSAELTVLVALPNCTTNIGPNGFVGEDDCRHPIDEIRTSCSIEYTGNIAPEMKWMTTPGQNTIQSQPITNVSEKTVSSELNVTAPESMNGTSVVWYSTQSTQVKWTSAPIKTLYPTVSSNANVDCEETCKCSLSVAIAIFVTVAVLLVPTSITFGLHKYCQKVRNQRSVEERPSSDHVYTGLTVPAHELDLYANASHTATVHENQFEAEAAEH